MERHHDHENAESLAGLGRSHHRGRPRFPSGACDEPDRHPKAAIVAAIVLTENTNMNFGFVIPGAGAGTAALATTGTVTPTGVTYLNGAAAGAWTATGTSGQPMVVTLDASDTITGPGPAMTIDTFTTDAPATFTSGSVSFHVGATLHVGTAAAQTAGNYSGSYTVTVNY